MRVLITLLIFIVISFNTNAQIITTIAGTGIYGYNGDNIPATDASMSGPQGLSVDTSGNIYFADRSNNRIRKISTAGIITTIAGNGNPSFSGDGGQATDAGLIPVGIWVDKHGNIFFTDEQDNRVRKINSTGIITTIEGNGTYGFSGDGGQATNAQLYYPWGITTDNSDNIYTSDRLNQRIRRVNTAGIISTIGGNGNAGYNGDGIAATLAMLNYPRDIKTEWKRVCR